METDSPFTLHPNRETSESFGVDKQQDLRPRFLQLICLSWRQGYAERRITLKFSD